MLSGTHLKLGARGVEVLFFALFLLSLLVTPAWAANLTASDTFPAIAYTGSDGTAPWSGNWAEFGDSTSAPITGTGQVRVVANSTTGGVTNCVATNCLRIGGNQVAIQNKGVLRQIDLSGVTSATLKFTYRRVRPSSSRTTGLGKVIAQVSSDGGATWQNLASYPFTTASDASRIQASFDITANASINTQIRFIGKATDNLGNETTNSTYVENSVGYLYVDNVQVDFVKPDTPPPPPTTGMSVSDSFASIAFNGSDGVAPNTNPGPWTSPWVETGETGTNAGPSAGLVRVVSSGNCASSNCLRIGGNGVNIANRGVSRVVDLSGNVVSANLSFVYKRVINTPPTGSGSVLVQASPNGTTWTTLTTIAFGAASDLSPVSANFDIKSFAAASTRIRFLGQGTNANGFLFVDNVKVAYNVNNAPAFSGTPYSFAVSTPITVGATVGTVAASDPEGGAITYTITTDSSGGAFTLASPTITIANSSNLAPGQYTVLARATDPGGAFTEVPVTITVSSGNQPPVFGQASYSFSVNQTAAIGTAVGGVAATDPEGAAISYSITAGNTGNVLAIIPTSGAINVSGPLTAGTLKLTVSATDAGGAHTEVPVTVTVNQVTVDLKLLIISMGPAATDPLNKDGPNTTDGVLGYIQRFLEQAGVPYDVFDASAASTLTASQLTDPSNPAHGLYNGIILTDTTAGGNFASAEWTALHNYERDFKVREVVLSGLPTYSWPQCVPPTFVNCDFDYGMVDNSWTNNVSGSTAVPIQAQWSSADTRFTSVNKSGLWTITDFAWYATPRNDATVTTTPLLTEQGTGKALISHLAYADGREVLLSSIGNAWFLLYSEALTRDFVNFATKGLFIGGAMAYLNLHVDDLFLGDNLWDPVNNWTGSDLFERLAGSEIPNVAAKQNAFRAAHPFAADMKLEFAFNGSGTGIDKSSGSAAPVPACTALIAAVYGLSPTDPQITPLLADSMANVVLYKDQFGFINHTYTHLDLDFSRHLLAGGPTLDSDYENEITCNRLVWQNLGLPEYDQNLNTMVTGEHSGIKDDGYHNEATSKFCYADSYFGSHCVDEVNAPFPEPPLNVLLNDPAKAFPYSGNPRFFAASQGLGLRYLASDASQVNQAVEQFVRNVPTNRYTNPTTTLNFNQVLLPRYPTNVFYNVWYPGDVVDCTPTTANSNCLPGSLVDEYNNLIRERPLADYLSKNPGGTDYCVNGIAQAPYQGSICATRDYATILTAEADTGVRHILSWQMYPHFFHEINLKPYDATGSTLLFDWANSVMALYETYMKLPVKSLPYWQVGQLTEERLNARNAGITGVWNVSAGTVTLRASRTAKAIVTGVEGTEPPYGGQSIQTVDVSTAPVVIPITR
jgi:hypothetical protein